MKNSIETLAAKGRDLFNCSEMHEAQSNFSYWDHEVSQWLDEGFPNSGLSADWSSQPAVSFYAGRYELDDPHIWSQFHSSIRHRLKWISMIPRHGSLPKPITNGKQVPELASSRKIFVVHGHNDGIRESVARTLSKLDLEPVILHEQTNNGQTIIEKFENHADVAFAVVLLTADDVGSAKSDPDAKLSRARQNVIFEHGYFIGKLGRKRVCALYEDGVELPSDLSGVVYVLIDRHAAWQITLAKEIKAAGVHIDLNKLA